MKIERPQLWWIDRAGSEPDIMFGAGLTQAHEADQTRTPSTSPETTRIAFGRFVSMMRRKKGLSLERLAEIADVDASDLLVIEEAADQTPDPRTVFNLANTFSVPKMALMQLAGLTVANDTGLNDEAVRFAARSESLENLTPEQSSALDAFVAVLSQRGGETGDAEHPPEGSNPR